MTHSETLDIQLRRPDYCLLYCLAQRHSASTVRALITAATVSLSVTEQLSELVVGCLCTAAHPFLIRKGGAGVHIHNLPRNEVPFPAHLRPEKIDLICSSMYRK